MAKKKLSIKKKLLYSLIPAVLLFAALEAILWIAAPLPDPYKSSRFHQFLPAGN